MMPRGHPPVDYRPVMTRRVKLLKSPHTRKVGCLRNHPERESPSAVVGTHLRRKYTCTYIRFYLSIGTQRSATISRTRFYANQPRFPVVPRIRRPPSLPPSGLMSLDLSRILLLLVCIYFYYCTRTHVVIATTATRHTAQS